MVLPEYTDDKFWNDAIQQYGQHKNGIFLHPQIEYHIWMYFKSFLRRNNRYFLDSPILQLFASIFENHIYILKSGTVIYRARIDDDRSLEGDWMDYMDVKSTPEILDRLRRNKGDTEIYKQLVSDYENHINSDEYLATQYITALIEHIGYDGLRFRSSLVKNGTNYVIFNPSNCHIESSKLVLLTDVTYTYGQYK